MEPEPDGAAVGAYWAEFCAATGTEGQPSDVFGFGDSEAMAERLLAMVLTGTKRATSGALVDYQEDGAMPEVGAFSVLVDGRGEPRAVIETTEVRIGPLSSVDDAFAWDDGEGDRTRERWVAKHQEFFRRWFAATGRRFDEDPLLVFERFRVVHPFARADR